MIVYIFGQNRWDAAADGHPVCLARVPVRVFDRFLDVFSCFRFGSEADHQLSTARSNALLVEGVEGLLAFLAHMDQIRFAQDGEMDARRWVVKRPLFLRSRSPIANSNNTRS